MESNVIIWFMCLMRAEYAGYHTADSSVPGTGGHGDRVAGMSAGGKGSHGFGSCRGADAQGDNLLRGDSRAATEETQAGDGIARGESWRW